MWVNPILNWSKFDVHAYKARYDLPDNWVVEVLHMSGECLCGAYARRKTKSDAGELAEIRMWFPETAAYIDALTVKVKAAGHNWNWDEYPPSKPKTHLAHNGILDRSDWSESTTSNDGLLARHTATEGRDGLTQPGEPTEGRGDVIHNQVQRDSDGDVRDRVLGADAG